MFLGNLDQILERIFTRKFASTSVRNNLPKFFRLLTRPNRIAFFFVGLCIFSLVIPQIAPVFAQVNQATVQEIIDGNQVFIQSIQASLNDIAKQEQQVRTGTSRTALLFNTGAVARLSANSVLRIGQCAQLRRGTILVNGALNACSSGVTAGVRGTTYIIEISESGNQNVKVLEGEVVVKPNAIPFNDLDDSPTNSSIDSKPSTKPETKKPKVTLPTTLPKLRKSSLRSPPSSSQSKNFPQDNPQRSRPLEPLNAEPANRSPILKVEQDSQTSKQPDEVVLSAGQELAIDNKGVLGIIQQISESEFKQLLQGTLFQGFTYQIPGIDKVKAAFEGLFPGVNFPISLPNIRTPSISIPGLPRFPF